MTDREAIECFESHCKNCSIKDECKRLKEKGKLVCRNTNAISALQERIDLERGCEFCSDNFDFWASRTPLNGWAFRRQNGNHWLALVHSMTLSWFIIMCEKKSQRWALSILIWKVQCMANMRK